MHFELYRSGLLRRDWRWRLRAKNGRIIAHSGEGYRNRGDALSMIYLIRQEAACATIEALLDQ